MFKHITKTVWLIAFVSLFNDISSEMLYPVIPLYLDQIGYGSLLIGILEGVAEFLSGLSKIYTGSLSDSLKRRLPFVQLGYGLSILSRPLMGLFQAAFPIVSARILDRIGKGIRTGARDAILADESTPETRAGIFGFHRSMDTLGAVIGPCAALIFLYFYPAAYRTLILLTIIPGLIAFAFTLRIKEKTSALPVQKKSWKAHFGYFKNANPNYKKLVLILLFFALAGSSDMYLLLKAKENGLHEREILMAYILFNLVFALTAFPIGKWADKLGKRNMLLAGLILYAITYGLIGFNTSILSITIGFIVYGLYYACTDGVIKALLTNMVPKTESATAIGFYAGMNGIVLLCANLLAGWAWLQFGPTALFAMSLIITFLSFLFLLSFRKTSSYS